MLKVKWSLLLLTTFTISLSYSQKLNGPGNCIKLNGIDEYINLGDVYNDLILPVTVSAWINVDNSVNSFAPIFVSQDNSKAYKGFVFTVTNNRIGIEYGDGRGWNNGQYRRSKGAYIGDITNKWIHVAGVIRSERDMDLYVNGVNVGGEYTGSSDYPMANLPGDEAKIGTWYSNNKKYFFKGMIDEVKLWNYSRSAEEIRNTMCKKLKGNELGLIGYWKFDENSGDKVIDHSENNFYGKLINGGERILSGAAIGDASNYIYDNLSNTKASIAVDEQNYLVVDNISDNSKGIQVYRIDSDPNHTQNIDSGIVTPYYYGLYICNITEEVEYILQIVNDCGSSAYIRKNNSDLSWEETQSSSLENFTLFNYSAKSIELFPIKSNIPIWSAPDTIICSGETIEFKLDPLIYYSIEWSNGSTESKLKINDPGLIWVKAQSKCGSLIDTINVWGINKPIVDISEVGKKCVDETIKLSATSQNSDNLVWQNGSKDSSIFISDPGIYWVRAENKCGISYDSIRVENKSFGKVVFPNVITPNGDDFNDKFVVDDRLINAQIKIYSRWGQEIFSTSNYYNDWPINSNVMPGVYYFLVEDTCMKKAYRGALHVLQ